ncbi:MAG: hypothetical protein ACTHM9_01915, partial [Gemmatimonadales bacterium]
MKAAHASLGCRNAVALTGMLLALSLSSAPIALAQAPPSLATVDSVLGPLVEAHGVSGMEGPVRATVQRLLPRGARTETDTAGNLWLRMGRGEPTVVFVAHLDEIGFQVTAVRDDGTVEATAQGGFFPSLWEGQPALVHTGTSTVPGVFVPHDTAAAPPAPGTPPVVLVDVGTADRAAT